MTIRNSSDVKFEEVISNYDVHAKSPYLRGCKIWRQLPSYLQNAATKKDFTALLTHDVTAGLYE